MYYRALVVSKAHKMYFKKELNSAHQQTIHTKEGKIRREENLALGSGACKQGKFQERR
jgi:hypothetical protein